MKIKLNTEKYLGVCLLFLTFVNSSIAQTFSTTLPVRPDNGQLCDGTIGSVYSIKFGNSGSGEAIMSKKTTGGNVHGLDFFTASTLRFRITVDGKIAIGSHMPTTRLSLGSYTTSDVSQRFSLYDNGNDQFGVGFFQETLGSQLNSALAFYTDNISGSFNRFAFFNTYNGLSGGAANGTEYFTINSTNRSVGIGMNSLTDRNPRAALHVLGQTDLSHLLGAIMVNQDHLLAKFETSTTYNGRFLTIGIGRPNQGYMEIYAGNSSDLASELVIRGSKVGVGVFPSAPGFYNVPQSQSHIQGGILTISKTGITPISGLQGLQIGSTAGNGSTNTNSCSWLQSSNGPLVLNPLSGNTMASSSNTNNYVAIGFQPTVSTPPPIGYNLVVQGKIMCEELKVKLQSGWYDHVLQPGYNLITLDSLQNYITTNSHLPDIPSAAQVEEEGIEAGAMSGLLLKKIEELTLYMIEQNKKLGTQEDQIELLKKQNELLMQQIALMQEQYKSMQSSYTK